ncbi:hypothetical protein IM41_03150 [Fervidobacterium sp. SC_NGM5_G05]|nr:hypothetical protein IM41_03150 [Fervidobacterium sp. SC_NGM5_G05]
MGDKIPDMVRRERSIKKAQEVLLNSNISSLPVNVNTFFETYKIYLVDYDTAICHCNGFDPFKFKNNDNCLAATYLMSGKYLTIYKDDIQPYGRLV